MMESKSTTGGVTKPTQRRGVSIVEPLEVMSLSQLSLSAKSKCNFLPSDNSEIAPDDNFDEEFVEELNAGHIDLAFPENPEVGEKYCYPSSYYTFTEKEKLTLLFAENFRKQFLQKYLDRHPLVLAPKNECGIQKFVCSTLRPTAFLHPNMIQAKDFICTFVADYINYEPLKNPIALPPNIISPATLLRRRSGNSFEMSILLCSMLIGAGFPALVVSGIARHETTLNNQRSVECPFVPNDTEFELPNLYDTTSTCGKYELRKPADLESHLDDELAILEAEKQAELKKIKDEEDRIKQDYEDLQSIDKYHNRRLHSWVVIIDNAPWSLQPRKKILNEEGIEINAPPSAYFIETTTGFRQETKYKGYIFVNSIWNNYNYYVNRQNTRPKEMNWDLSNLDEWEHFLPGEPPQMRVERVKDEEEEEEVKINYNTDRHLDVLNSWVEKLYIGDRDLEQLFPNEEKIVNYKNAIHERYSPYFKRDGKVVQLTLYENCQYDYPIVRWEWYENRQDFLTKRKIDYKTMDVKELFFQGRPDSLKFFEHNSERPETKYLHFYHLPRFDALKLLIIFKDKIVFHYTDKSDFCCYQEFKFNFSFELEEAIEKFDRNESKPANKDIAVRTFLIPEKEINLKYQYAKGSVTASTRQFKKPPRPDYGHEIVFDPNLTKGYNANPNDPQPTQVELYFLLLKQLESEEKIKNAYQERLKEINMILDQLISEKISPKLKFRIFDPLRNEGARRLKLKEYADEALRKQENALKEADFLAPYLAVYKNRDPTHLESMTAFNSCLNDLKTRYVNLLNGLQRKYEDLTAEYKAMKKFLNKFQDHFDNTDYERLVQEVKIIELNKRMVQQRLAITHEEAQTKYEKVRKSLEKDPRLNLKSK